MLVTLLSQGSRPPGGRTFLASGAVQDDFLIVGQPVRPVQERAEPDGPGATDMSRRIGLGAADIDDDRIARVQLALHLIDIDAWYLRKRFGHSSPFLSAVLRR